MSGIAFGVQAEGLGKFQNRMRGWRGMAPIHAAEATMWTAAWGVEFVKQNASGRPGPNVVTGAYRESIRILDSDLGGLAPFANIGTDAEQAARLEFGFVGVDSLGRHYAQPPFPHWRPAIPMMAAAYRMRMHTFTKELIAK